MQARSFSSSSAIRVATRWVGAAVSGARGQFIRKTLGARGQKVVAQVPGHRRPDRRGLLVVVDAVGRAVRIEHLRRGSMPNALRHLPIAVEHGARPEQHAAL